MASSVDGPPHYFGSVFSPLYACAVYLASEPFTNAQQRADAAFHYEASVGRWANDIATGVRNREDNNDYAHARTIRLGLDNLKKTGGLMLDETNFISNIIIEVETMRTNAIGYAP